MEPWLIATLVCFAYLILSLITGVAGKHEGGGSVSGFVAGSRSMQTFVLYFVIGATVFSSFAFLGTPAWAYTRGAAVYYVLAYGVIGLLPLYFLGPRAARLGLKFEFVTQAELLAHRYQSNALSKLLAVVSVMALLPYLALQMRGAGYIFEVVSNGHIPAWLGAALAYIVVIIYVWYSGVWGVGWSSIFQGALMLVVAAFLLFYIPNTLYGGIEPMFTALLASDFAPKLTAPGTLANGSPWPWTEFFSAVLVSACGYAMWPHLFMKSFTAKSEAALKKSLLLYPSFQLFLVPMVIVGFAAVLKFPGVSPADTILPHVLNNIGLPELLIGLIFAGALAASMSSGDAMVHAAAAITVRDGLRGTRLSSAQDVRQTGWIKVLVIVYGLVAYLIAMFTTADIVQLLLGSYGGIAQLLPIALAAFYWPDVNGKAAVSALSTGIAVNSLFFLMPELKPWAMHEGIYGLAANLFVLISVTLTTRPQSREHLAHYFDLDT
jgi:SSS family solute:Na+ symporter